MFSKFFFIPYRENMFVYFPQGSTIPSIRGACVHPCAILFIRFAEFKIQLRYLGLCFRRPSWGSVFPETELGLGVPRDRAGARCSQRPSWGSVFPETELGLGVPRGRAGLGVPRKMSIEKSV